MSIEVTIPDDQRTTAKDVGGVRADRAMVSQGTRAMAQNRPDALVAEAKREQQSLLAEMAALECELSEFSDGAMAAAQSRIRSQYRNRSSQDSINAWAQEKGQMLQKRQKLIARKLEIQLRLPDLKSIISAADRTREASVKPLLYDEMKIQSGLMRDLIQRSVETNKLLARIAAAAEGILKVSAAE